MDQTPFKNFFVQLVRLYLKPDWTWGDFVKLQTLHGEIINGHSTNLNSTEPSPINFAEYELLNHMARYLTGEMRAVLQGMKR